MAAQIPSYTLNNGTQIPSVGMGCWMGAPGGEQAVYDMCINALNAGYRHFDTAAGYANEQFVGKAIRDSGIPRSEIYVTTKLADHTRVKEAFEESFNALDVDYIDLYLMHWPQANLHAALTGGRVLAPEESPTFVETWIEMEKLLESVSITSGKVKSIGVSNFSIKNLEILLPHCTVIPVTNQVELHPCYPQNDLKAYCESKRILLTAYSPLGQGTFFVENAEIIALAKKNNATPAQVVLSWAVQRGTVVIPKSANKERMAANIKLLKLSDEDFEAVGRLHTAPGLHKSLVTYDKKEDSVFGWTFEQLGWNLQAGGLVVSS
ncbi:unnamed protein product [Mycena citricolor]|uniref:NADP-dependent oxidoreductase domain-containing protein n=1 Tax=Mycena citricolor TaxID=2018698 RepID=A0AAD2HV27_9AGAR|nr:unnamed protein product [Mycena citricolor]